MSDLTSRDYWNERTKSMKEDLNGMVFMDTRVQEHYNAVCKILSSVNGPHATVLDIGCGWGRFADTFWPESYTGVDFSEEMVVLAKSKYPSHTFVHGDAHALPEKQYDVVFGVIVTSSLGITPKEFIEKYTPYAKRFVMCFEPDEFLIKPIL